MSVVVCQKLVRDKIQDFSHPKGVSFSVADEKEYQGYLANKICEESEELWASIVCPEGSTKKDILEEAADVLEVLYAIGLYHGFDQADLHRAMLQKRSKKGGFNKRIIMLTEKATPV